MAGFMIRLLRDRRGATAIEYSLLAALIALVVIGGIQNVGDVISNKLYNNIVEGLNR